MTPTHLPQNSEGFVSTGFYFRPEFVMTIAHGTQECFTNSEHMTLINLPTNHSAEVRSMW